MVLHQDSQKAQWILIPCILLLTLLTMVSYFGYFNNIWSNFPWIASTTTPEILLGLDAMAILGLLNARFKADIWLSSIFYLPLVALIWIVARSVIVTSYLSQSSFQEIVNNPTINMAGKNAEQIIYGSITEQNFTIVAIFLMLSLWATFLRMQIKSPYTVISNTTMIVLGSSTILNAGRLLYAVPNFFTVWIALLAISMILLLVMIVRDKGNEKA
jgi:hypothetical protein